MSFDTTLLLKELEAMVEWSEARTAALDDEIAERVEETRRLRKRAASAFSTIHAITGQPHPLDPSHGDRNDAPAVWVKIPTASPASTDSDSRSSGLLSLLQLGLLNECNYDRDRPSLFDLLPRPRHEIPPEGRLREIADVFGEQEGMMKAAEIADELEKRGLLDGVENPTAAVTAHLSRGIDLGIFERVARGYYALARHAGESISADSDPEILIDLRESADDTPRVSQVSQTTTP